MSEREMLRLYDYPASCNCYKVRLLLAQLGRPYERVAVDIFDGETLTAEFAVINPARSTPVLETPQGSLPESNAILVHLAPGTRSPSRGSVRAGAGRAVAHLRADRRHPRHRRPALPPPRGPLDARPPRGDQPASRGGGVLQLLDDHLASRTFPVADRYTIADIAVYGYTHRAAEARDRSRAVPARPRLAHARRAAARLHRGRRSVRRERRTWRRQLDLRVTRAPCGIGLARRPSVIDRRLPRPVPVRDRAAWSIPRSSRTAQCSRIRPSEMRRMCTCCTSKRRPVGAWPRKTPS